MEKYFYLNSKNEQVGPVSPEDFTRLGINEGSMVWKQGMKEWMRAGHISELSPYFKATPPPPPFPPITSPISNNAGSSVGVSSQVSPVKPDNNMTLAILSTLFCCLPLGVYSIVQASKVNGLYLIGKHAEAQAMADDAKKWASISAVCGFIIFVIYFIIGFIGALG